MFRIRIGRDKQKQLFRKHNSIKKKKKKTKKQNQAQASSSGKHG